MGLGELPRRASEVKWMGLPIKHFALVTVTIQNSALILVSLPKKQELCLGLQAEATQRCQR